MASCVECRALVCKMAVVALEKLEEQLNCSICLDTYTNPKVLQCNHVYCQQCLVRLLFRDQQGQLILTCPNCRQVTPVPANGVAGLQAAFRVNKLLEIAEEQKKAVAFPKNPEGVSTSPASHGSTRVGCPEHGGREVELYCNTCEKAICFKCIMKDEKHHSHNYEVLNKALEIYQQEIASSLEPLEKQLETIKKALQQFDVRHGEIFSQLTAIEADIHSTVARLHKTLDVRKTELISQLHQLTQAKLKSLAAHRDQIETTQAQLSSCLHFMRENLKTGNRGVALLMKSTTVRQVKELTTTFQPDMLEPKTEADMIFLHSMEIATEIESFGEVLDRAPPDPSKCTATGKGVEVAAVGEKSTAFLQILSSKDVPSKAAPDSITCELVSEIIGTRVRGSVERRGQTQYEISYQPTIKGRHQLHIKVEGQHIRGSPFPVAVMSSVEKLGTPISAINEVKGPVGVAVNQRGEVVVAEGDKGGRCVTVFSPRGERLRSFGRFRSKGVLLNPAGVDGEGNIFAADQLAHRIKKFSAHGVLLREVSIEGYTGVCPRGVSFSPSTNMVYVTAGQEIYILDSDLKHTHSFGKYGKSEGEFTDPFQIAFDITGNVYVADSGNSRVQIFTSEGKFLQILAYKGREEIKNPVGIAVDSNGHVYVSDSSTGRVFVFTSSGQMKLSLDIGKKHCLRALAVDSSGVLYVCDQGSRSIKLF